MLEQPQIPNHQLQIELSICQANKNTILIIDDAISNLEFLREILINLDFKLLFATNSETAIYQAEYYQPNLILLDTTSPIIDGFETCRQLKLNKLTKNISVVLMTEKAETECKIKSFKLGAVDYITKPILPAELLARVTTHLTIQNLQKQLEEQNVRLQKQMETERLIASMQERIRKSLNLEEILNTTVNEVRQFLQTDRVIIYQFKSKHSGFVAVESVSPEWTSVLENASIDSYITENLFNFYREREDKDIKNIYPGEFNRCYVDLLTRFQVKSDLVVTIRQGEELWGLLIALQCSRSRQWQQVEIDLLKQFVTQVGIAIQQAQLYEELKMANRKLRRIANLDSLTQLANRRRFNAYLNQEWRRLQIEESDEFNFCKSALPLSLILCDVDFFKLYNDTYGHLAGDFCLQQIAQAIQAAVNRPGALVARYGGEELAVILPNTKPRDAFYLAEQIRRRVKALKISHTRSPIRQYVTLSLGVASTVPSDVSSPAKLVVAADKALYKAKKQGRDRTYIIGLEDCRCSH
ncbi:diguanylate cyclase [Planktothrix sp. FACHB-1355]|uniref:Diguanylate cyclase n=1 Tax=Aerosakkonema funiforme FACHB-1375 TaxID=2949571 RepID=A0A926VFH9_9CYAN|nr:MULTISPECIES: diguanylate cyclase [Oscillatoriales]MBD2182935.1 diguanylate cyclase [Aerosakkonema funiforme FACHB-1375]MBD3558901.1 diguanylate cyclase [Planktothrix sp. FACHB-1355]